jgi:hypothetical protein
MLLFFDGCPPFMDILTGIFCHVSFPDGIRYPLLMFDFSRVYLQLAGFIDQHTTEGPQLEQDE